MKEVKDLEEQAKVLMAHLPSKQSAAASKACLSQLWRAAGRPAQRTGRVTEEATRLASSQNEQPLAVQHVRPLGEAAADAGTPPGDRRRHPPGGRGGHWRRGAALPPGVWRRNGRSGGNG